MFKHFYRANVESGVFGVYEKVFRKMYHREKVGKWADWVEQGLGNESTTTSILNTDTATDDETNLMPRPKDAKDGSIFRT